MAHLDYYNYPDPPNPPVRKMKRCPYCAEDIQEEANVCRYCSRRLEGHNGFLYGVAMLIFVAVAIYDLVYSLWFLYWIWDFAGVAIGVVFAPVLVIVPLYTWFVYGWWLPAVTIYGGGIISYALFSASER